MEKCLPSRGIATLGWLSGLAVAAGADYVLVPKLVEISGQKAIAVIVGLIAGAKSRSPQRPSLPQCDRG